MDVDNEPLCETDALELIRLLNEVISMNAPFPAKRRHVWNRLATLIDADAWVWVLSDLQTKSGLPEMVLCELGGNLDRETFNSWVKKRYESPELYCSPTDIPHTAQLVPNVMITRSRRQLISDQEWYESAFATHVLDWFKIDDFVQSVTLIQPAAQVSGIGYHRNAGRAPFSARDRRLLHIVTTEFSWMHREAMPAQDTREAFGDMPQRLRKVLWLLLEGQSRQQMATQLNLSQHTINDYVQELYALFKVTSHPELMRRFMIGDGGDLTNR